MHFVLNSWTFSCILSPVISWVSSICLHPFTVYLSLGRHVLCHREIQVFWSPCLALYWSGIMEWKKRPAVCGTRSNDGAHSRRGNRASKLLLQPIIGPTPFYITIQLFVMSLLYLLRLALSSLYVSRFIYFCSLFFKYIYLLLLCSDGGSKLAGVGSPLTTRSCAAAVVGVN